MSWRTDLIDRLADDTDLANLLGTRISWFEAHRSWSTYPQLVLQEVSPGRDYTHSGPDGLDRPIVQFDIWATTTESLEAVEAALAAEMEQDGVEQGDTRYFMALLERRFTRSPEDLGDQRKVLGVTMDYGFNWEAI